MEEQNSVPQSLMKKQKRRCYYEVLQVARDATALEIKSQYKKMALKYHPDKNPDYNAKQRFVEIQQAFKILSDVNQRTWYDNNRESVLYNKHEMTAEEFEMQTFGFNVKPYFKQDCFQGFEDGPEGFYSVYRKLFELIKEEERKAYEYNRANRDVDDEEQGEYKKYMGFGASTSNAEDVMQFYNDWEAFDTFKTFAWADEYNIKQAENRDVKRQMMKENKKERLKERKKYITTVRDLIAIVKKWDPRREAVNEHLKKQAEYRAEQKRRKIEEDRLRRKKEEQDRIRQAEEMRKKLNAEKSEEQRQKERQQMIEKPKIVEKREKLVRHQCATCGEIFKDFNKHFQHLQKTGHTKS